MPHDFSFFFLLTRMMAGIMNLKVVDVVVVVIVYVGDGGMMEPQCYTESRGQSKGGGGGID